MSNANWRGTNSRNVVWIDTSMHRCTQMEEDVSYPIEDLRQGRDATNPVPRFSMLAGKPIQDDTDTEARSLFWRSYFYSVAGIAICSALLAYWP